MASLTSPTIAKIDDRAVDKPSITGDQNGVFVNGTARNDFIQVERSQGKINASITPQGGPTVNKSFPDNGQGVQIDPKAGEDRVNILGDSMESKDNLDNPKNHVNATGNNLDLSGKFVDQFGTNSVLRGDNLASTGGDNVMIVNGEADVTVDNGTVRARKIPQE